MLQDWDETRAEETIVVFAPNGTMLNPHNEWDQTLIELMCDADADLDRTLSLAPGRDEYTLVLI